MAEVKDGIVFAFVALGQEVLTSVQSKNYDKTARKILAKKYSDGDPFVSFLVSEQPKFRKKGNNVVNLQGHNFHCLTEENISFVCMSNEGYGSTVPKNFLQMISGVFKKHFPGRMIENEPLSSYQQKNMVSFRQSMENQMLLLSDGGAPDLEKYSEIQQGLEQTKEAMINNIEKVMLRGDAIESLVHKTDSLATNSYAFRRSSKKLKQRLCCAEMKTKLAVGGIASFVMYIMLAAACGTKLQHCI